MLPKELTRDIKTRLKSIKGQVDGLINMLDKENDPENILVQFKAVQQGLDKSHYLLLDETYRKALALKISETAEACPGNCGNEERIEYIRQQFPRLEFNDLSKKMQEITEIKKRLDQHNENG